MSLKSGDIFFVIDHTGFIAKILSGAMGSKYSHCGVIFEQGELATYTIETNDYCICHANFDRYLTEHHTFEVYRPKGQDPEKTKQVLCDVEDQLLNKVYAYWQLISFGIRRLFRSIFKLQIRNFFRGNHVCCGVVLNYLKRQDILIFDQFEDQDLDVQDLYEIVTNCGEFELVLEKSMFKI